MVLVYALPGLKYKLPIRIYGMCRLPKCYGKKMREKMRAGPGCEDLKMRCPYFYTVASGLQPFVYNDDALSSFVVKTFRARYQVSIPLAACVRFSMISSQPKGYSQDCKVLCWFLYSCVHAFECIGKLNRRYLAVAVCLRKKLRRTSATTWRST